MSVKARQNPRNERPMSLSPLTTEQALRRAMSTPAPDHDPQPTTRKKAKTKAQRKG